MTGIKLPDGVKSIVLHLGTLPLVDALWYFIENPPSDEKTREAVTHYLRTRYRTSQDEPLRVMQNYMHRMEMRIMDRLDKHDSVMANEIARITDAEHVSDQLTELKGLVTLRVHGHAAD